MIIREGLFNGKREVKSKIEVPDHKREEELTKEYNDTIKKNFSKIASVVKKVSTKPEYKDAAKGLKMESFSPCAKSSRIFSNKENGYIYAFSYDIASVDISKVYKNPRAQMNEDGAKEYSDFVKEIISDASSYVKVITHNAYVEDGGDWDMALISIIIPYTGEFVTESFTVLDDEDDDILVTGGEDETFIEATGTVNIASITSDIPEDFKKTVLKAVKKGYEISNRGIGVGAMDAALGSLGLIFAPLLKKTENKIDSKPAKGVYVIIVPQKARIKPDKTGGNANFPKEYEKIATEMMKAAGFKKGSSFKFMDKDIYYYYKKSGKYLYIATMTAPAAYFVLRTQVQIAFRCCEYTEERWKEVTESATEIPDEREAFTRYFDVEDVEPSLTDDPEEEYYRDPIFNKAITEHFNMLNTKTRRTLLHLNEAQQNSVVMSLTSKLYDKIVEKCEDIDYGEIPATKGDITKLSKYESMKETIAIMHDLLKEYNQDTGPVDELSVALSNVESRREIFERAYRYNSELPMVMYCNIVLGIITGISYMIATCIEFIKDPGSENFRISLDKIAYAKSKDHMIYNTLKSFNKTCANKEFDKAMEAVLKTSTKNFGGAVAAGSIAMVALGTILVLIPVLRELIFMFYYMRMRISDFYDMQADLLQANAYSIEANSTLDKSEQKKIMAKQLNYVAKFRKISNAFAIDIKKAEVESDKSKKADDETKMLIDDIDGIDTGSNGSSLF